VATTELRHPLLTAVWINKPKKISRTEGAEGVNFSMTAIEQKGGFHNCPITNDQPSGSELQGENQPSENFALYL
jgi:hypothetical protein